MLSARISTLLCLLSIFASCEWKPPRRGSTPSLPVLKPIIDMEGDDEVGDTSTRTSTRPEGGYAQELHDQRVEPEPAPAPAPAPKPSSGAQEDTSPSVLSSALPPSPQEVGARDYLFAPVEESSPQVYLKELTVTARLRYKTPGPKVSEVSLATLAGSSKELVGFVRVRNFVKPQKVTMRWVYLGGEAPEELHVTRHSVGISPRWRTWSRLNIRRIGDRLGRWRLDVYRRSGRSRRGDLIGRQHFTVTL